MARYVADQNKVLFKYESGTYANTSGNGQWFGLVQNHELSTETNVESLRYAGAATRDASIHVDGPEDHAGTLTYHPQDWKMLLFALGSCADGGSPSPYTHTLLATNSNDTNAFTSGADNPFISFTIEDSQTAPNDGQNFIRTAKGCVVDEFTFNWSEGGITECELSYVAQSVTYSSGATSSVTAATNRPFLWQDVRVSAPSGTLLNEAKEGSFRISNNLNPPHYNNGSRQIGTPIPEMREYELNVTLHGTSERTKALYDQYFRGGSEFNSILQVVDASAGTGSRDLTLTLSGCKIVAMTAPSPVEGTNEQTLTIVPKTVTGLVNDTIEKYNPW